LYHEIITIGNNDGNINSGITKGYPDGDIPAICTEDEIIIGELNGSNTNPQNIPNGSRKAEIEFGSIGTFHGNTKTAIDIDNMFDNIVGVKGER